MTGGDRREVKVQRGEVRSVLSEKCPRRRKHSGTLLGRGVCSKWWRWKNIIYKLPANVCGRTGFKRKAVVAALISIH